MLKENEKWTAEKIQETGALILICSLFSTTIAIMAYFMILGAFLDPKTGQLVSTEFGDPTVFSTIFWIAVAILWVIIIFVEFKYAYIYPLQRGVEMQNECNKAKLFLEGKWRKSQDPPEYFFIGVEYMTRLIFDWDNPNTLLPYSFDVDYNKFAGLLMWEDYIESHEDKSATEAQEKFIEHLKKRYAEITEKAAGKKEGKEGNTTPPPEQIAPTPLVPIPGEEEEEKDIEKLLTTPYRTFDLNTISAADKEYLKSLYFYFVKYTEEEIFEDSRIPMDCAIIITTEPAEKILDSSPRKAEYLGWSVMVPGVDVFIDLIEFVTKNMPLGFVSFTEKMTITATNVLEQITLEAYTYLQLRIMEKWVNHLRKKGTQSSMAIEEAEGKAEMFKTLYADRISEEADNDLTFGRVLKHELVAAAEEKIKRLLNKYKTAVALFCIAGVIALFLLFFVIGGANNVPADIAQSSAGILSPLFFLHKKRKHKKTKLEVKPYGKRTAGE